MKIGQLKPASSSSSAHRADHIPIEADRAFRIVTAHSGPGRKSVNFEQNPRSASSRITGQVRSESAVNLVRNTHPRYREARDQKIAGGIGQSTLEQKATGSGKCSIEPDSKGRPPIIPNHAPATTLFVETPAAPQPTVSLAGRPRIEFPARLSRLADRGGGRPHTATLYLQGALHRTSFVSYDSKAAVELIA